MVTMGTNRYLYRLTDNLIGAKLLLALDLFLSSRHLSFIYASLPSLFAAAWPTLRDQCSLLSFGSF